MALSEGADRGRNRDRRSARAGVVEAYWVGNSLLDRSGSPTSATPWRTGSGPAPVTSSPHLVEGVLAGGVPHHSFHVFEIYPWLGLLRGRPARRHRLERAGPLPDPVGRVLAITGDEAVVRSRPLVWDGRRLAVGGPVWRSAVSAWADSAQWPGSGGRDSGVAALGLGVRPAGRAAAGIPARVHAGAAGRCEHAAFPPPSFRTRLNPTAPSKAPIRLRVEQRTIEDRSDAGCHRSRCDAVQPGPAT